MPHVPRLLAAALAAAVVALASPAGATWSTSPFVSTPVCTDAADQGAPILVPDGSGGAFVAWADDRGLYSIYATRVTRDGVIAPGWPVNGFGVCTLTGNKDDLQLVAGAAGDVYAVWSDPRTGNEDVYAQRLLANGTVAPGWPANGLAITSDVRNQFEPRAAADGSGGLFLVWTLEYTPGTDNDIYATRVLPSGAFAPSFAVNGIGINAASLVQNEPAIAADGAGNAIILYTNVNGSSIGEIWGQKLTSAGGRAWGSPGAGLKVSQGANDQRHPQVVTGNAGGAIMSDRLGFGVAEYVMLDGNGVVLDLLLESLPVASPTTLTSLVPDDAGGAWIGIRADNAPLYDGFLEHLDARLRPTTSSPVKVYNYANASSPPSVVPTAAGAAMGVWSTLADDVRAQGYDANVTTLWGPSSVMIAGAVGFQASQSAVSDGAGGAIAAWNDGRNGNFDVYAARVDRFGALGDAAPAFTRLADVPNDQGGSVSLQWSASVRDVAPTFPIARYSIWRRAPAGLTALREGEPARVIAAFEARPEGDAPVIRVESTATGVVFWEYLSQVPARGYAGYSAVAPTTSDSLAGTNPRTSFRIEAESASGIPYWDSAPDSAYSVDNLAPTAPAPFTGTFSGGTSLLAWTANTEPDLGVYRLYRGNSPAFVPSPATLIATQSHTGYADPAGVLYWYKLAAVDVHGNASPFATLLPSTTTSAGDPPLPRELALSAPAPNPARGGAVTLRCALPRPCATTLAIFDMAGRRVREMVNDTAPAGEYVVTWDGRGASGERVGAGLYVVRLTAEGRSLEQRLSLIR